MPYSPSYAWKLLYRDFLMPSRLSDYRRLLETAVGAGYQVTSIEDHWQRIARNETAAGRYLVLRHDIDTDPRTAREMWTIERTLGISGSYFFRLSSLDLPLMRTIAEQGGQASYHYEELATVAKRRRPRSRQALLGHLPEARAEFAANLDHLRRVTGLPMRVVASHGDFLNRKLGVPNTEVLADPAFRAEVGVDLETYDAVFMDHVTSRHADGLGPEYWRPSDPAGAIERGEPVIYLLIHPRNWRSNRRANAQDDLQRLWEGVRYANPWSIAWPGGKRD